MCEREDWPELTPDEQETMDQLDAEMDYVPPASSLNTDEDA